MKKIGMVVAFGLVAWGALPLRPVAAQQVIYSNLPAITPANVVSFGYQANQLAELGDLISFGGTARNLTSATVMLSDWSYQSEWASYANANATGFFVPLTFNIYNVGAANAVGNLIATLTQNTLIPWRPEPSPAQCGPGGTQPQGDYSTFHQWYGGDGLCHGGQADLVTFDFSALNVLLPSEVIYGLAFNTQSWGYNPIGVDGPYTSLNFGATLTPPSVGTSAAGIAAEAYGSSPAFQTDNPWTYKSMAEFRATDVGTVQAVTPEPATMSLMAFGLAGMAGVGIRRRKRSR